MQHGYEHSDEEVLKRVGENDPVIKSFETKKFKITTVVLIILGLVLLVPGFLGIFNDISFLNDAFSFACILIGAGLLLLGVVLLFLDICIRANWNRVQSARQAALHQPQQFLAKPQPMATDELPVQGEVRWRTKASVQIPYLFICYFVLWTVIEAVQLHPSLTVAHVLFVLLAAFTIALILTIISFFTNRRTSKTSIRVTQTDITTHFNGMQTTLKWEDARLFLCYRGDGIFWNRRKAYIYELLSEYVVLRWHQPKKPVSLFIEPAMDQQQFERWHEQLRGYVVGRTGLPLVELNLSTKNGKK